MTGKSTALKAKLIIGAVALLLMIVLATPTAIIIGLATIGALLVHYLHGRHDRLLCAIGGAGFFALLIQVPHLGPWANETVNQATSFGGPLAEQIHVPSFQVNTPTVAPAPAPAAAPSAPAAPTTPASAAPPSTAGPIVPAAAPR